MGSGVEQEFVVVVDGLSNLKDSFRPELNRKGLTLPTMFKKFIDIKSLFVSQYKGQLEKNVGDFFYFLWEWEEFTFYPILFLISNFLS